MIEACEKFLEEECGGKVFMMPSCTAALELACMMILEPGDEVIMPSWTFPSCANAVILRGAVPVFVDVDENLNIDVKKIWAAITSKTKAIMPVHYAGVGAHMSRVNDIASEHGLYVIEDAAQAIGNWIVSGDFGCLSFHYTKNIQCGQGGALVVNNPLFIEKAERMMHCGTDKVKMYRGEQAGYDWLEVGSQYIMSDYQARPLYENLQRLEELTERRQTIWGIYEQGLDSPCGESDKPWRAKVCGNGHIFWWMGDNKWDYIHKMRKFGVNISSHYDALHTTIPGKKYGRTSGPILKAVEAMNNLVKLDTSVTENEALTTCEVLWGNATIHNIL